MSEFTYRGAGVDIDLERVAIEALLRRLTFRRTGKYGMLSEIGHYSGLIDFGSQVLALTTDGVGTKMLLAEKMQNYRTIGIDCIAMNVNDLYVMNLEPIAFVDYIACDTLSPAVMAEIGEGLNEGARQANVSIVGGETATLKGMVHGLDLAGAALGVQEKGRVVTGERIAPKDLIVGVPSSGIHSNGLTLARKIAEAHGGYDQPLGAARKGGPSIGGELLKPTRIYREALKVCEKVPVHGMCHITGGGLLNFLRLSKHGFGIDEPLEPPYIFEWLRQAGNVSDEEMYRTFNMGMGFAFIVPEGFEEEVIQLVPDAKVVGKVVERHGVWIQGMELRWG